jgi:hypothetical protein
MTTIFIHLYFVIVFEILFYIYYIMPYEKALIYNLFDISEYTTDIQNKSLIVHYIEDQLECDKGQQRIDNYNYNLWLQCMGFIGILTSILLIIFLRDIWRIHQQYLTPITSGTMSQHNSRTLLVENDYKKTDDQPVCQTQIDTNPGPDSFSSYYWKTSKFVKHMGKTVRFIVLVGLFEYAFFTLIVNKYKIVNTKTILCKMVNE